MWGYGSVVQRISVCQQSLTFTCSWKVQEVKINSVGLHVHINAAVCVNMAHHS